MTRDLSVSVRSVMFSIHFFGGLPFCHTPSTGRSRTFFTSRCVDIAVTICVCLGGKVSSSLSGKPGDAVIRTSTSGPVVISRGGGTSRVPVVRPLITSSAARSRVQSSVIRTTLTRGTGDVTKATRHVIPAVSIIASRPSSSSGSQLMSISHQPKTATVTRVQSNSKLVTGRGSAVSLIQVRPSTDPQKVRGQKVPGGQKVGAVQAEAAKTTVAMIEPVKPSTMAGSTPSLTMQSTSATNPRPLGEATVARADMVAKNSMPGVELAQGGGTQAADRLGEFDGLLTSALEDLDDIGGHSILDDFSRPIAAAGPMRGGPRDIAGPMRGGPGDIRGGATDIPMGYGYTGMDRQFHHHPIPMQSPYLPYGMAPPPPPTYPWMPPTMNMNSLWMQQPMGGQPVGSSQPMVGHVGGSAVTNRSAAGSDSFPHSDNFDFGDGASFEPLGSDVNRSLTSLLADSEPPGFDMNFSRRNGASSHNPGYMPSYPGPPPMMSGYHPYHPYPMPYSAPHAPQKSHYYPPAPPQANTQFCNIPGSGFAPPSAAGYFPMHYPAGMPGPAGLYPGTGATGYMQPGSALMPGATSYGLPGHGMAAGPSAGESLTEFLLKNE